MPKYLILLFLTIGARVFSQPIPMIQSYDFKKYIIVRHGITTDTIKCDSVYFNGFGWFKPFGFGNLTGGSGVSITTGTNKLVNGNAAIVLDSLYWSTKNYVNTSVLNAKTDSSIYKTTYSHNQDTNKLHVQIAGKQAALVSGTNIKTINNTSLLGSGNIELQTSIDTTKTVSSGHYATQSDINGKVDKPSYSTFTNDSIIVSNTTGIYYNPYTVNSDITLKCKYNGHVNGGYTCLDAVGNSTNNISLDSSLKYADDNPIFDNALGKVNHFYIKYSSAIGKCVVYNSTY